MIVNSFLISFFGTYMVGCEVIRQLVFSCSYDLLQKQICYI